jgi:hypothetical protein
MSEGRGKVSFNIERSVARNLIYQAVYMLGSLRFTARGNGADAGPTAVVSRGRTSSKE